jgi:hypothetical protein
MITEASAINGLNKNRSINVRITEGEFEIVSGKYEVIAK